MSEAGRRRWWCVGAIAVVGGAVALGAWIGLSDPAPDEPIPQAAVPTNEPRAAEPGAWMHTTAHHQQCYPPQPQGEVIQTAAFVPQIPEAAVNTGTVVPVIPPQVPVMPPPPAPIGGPRSLDAGVVGSGTPLPTIPSIPGVGCQTCQSATVPISAATAVPPTTMSLPPVTPSIQAPAIPSPPNELAVAAEIPAVPAPQPMPVIPAMPSSLPVIPPPAPPSPVIPPPPASPAIPAPLSIPSVPANVASPAASAPTTPSLQFPDTIQPVLPVQPEKPLPPVNAGISVKPETPTAASAGTSPAPGGLPALPVLPALTAPDRPKAGNADQPVSAKDDFQPPRPAELLQRPEDDTMKTYHKHAAILALVGGLFAAPAAILADDDANKSAKTDKDKADLAALNKKIEDLTIRIGEMQKDQKILIEGVQAEQKKLYEAINGKKDKDGIPVESDRGLVEKVKQLTNRLDAIEKQLKPATSALRPQSPETQSSAVMPRAQKGIVKIVNEYPVPISMVINGVTSYKVEPQKSRDVEVPAGRFTYQLLESGAAPTDSTIRDGETVTLRIK
jgi:hypothetical protein